MPESNLKKQDTKFRKGVSGNPKGKPRGTRSKATVIAQTMLDGEVGTLVRKVIDQALGGDAVCLRLCLERLVPPRKDTPISINLPEIESAADIAKLVSVILAGLGSGALTPTEAKAVGDLVEVLRKALETAELEKRVTELEKQFSTKR